MDNFTATDLEKFKALIEAKRKADAEVSRNNAIGGALDALANRQSFGNFFLGQMNPKVDAGGSFRNRKVADPLLENEAQEKFLAEQRAKREALAMKDPESELSKQRAMMYSKAMPGLGDRLSGMSAEQMKETLPLLARQLEKQKDFQNDLALAKIKAGKSDKGIALDPATRDYWKKRGLTDEQLSMVESGLAGRNPLNTLNSIAEKDELSTTEGNVIADIDHSINELTSLLEDFDNYKDVIGPVDNKYPELLASKDWVERKNTYVPRIGKISDAYRKAITGTGASEFEIKNLMSRLPNEGDYDSSFKAKLKEALREAVTRKENYLNTLNQAGKFVADKNKISIPNQTPGKDKGLNLINTAIANDGANVEDLLTDATRMGPEDLQAYKWASKNSQDPRAQQILNRLKAKMGR